MVRKLTVKRKGFRVKPTTFRRNGKLIHRKGFRVKPTTFQIEDRGAPGRGKKVIPTLRKGELTNLAMDLGLLSDGEKIKDLNQAEIDELALAAADKFGGKSAFSKFQALITLRKNATAPDVIRFRNRLQRARDLIATVSDLTPKAAIRANIKRGKNKRGPG
jgi:hypothetical protein